jgi:uncharacterized surface protein with fasciclin (FAS1) repeats
MPARPLARLGAVLAAVLATLLATTLPASAAGTTPKGTASLAALLAKDGSGFDKNPYDYDILDHAVTAVLKAKPDSPVAVLADGKVALTAFLPTDRAFKRLATDVLGGSYASESAVFKALTGLGTDTIEKVLLYHVVPGATISYGQAVRSNGAVLNTALAGSTIKVKVVCHAFVQLRDADRNDRNPYVVQPNLNKGNRQIAHGINRVLRPIDLP